MNPLNRLFETDLNRYLITATSLPDDQGPTDELGSRRRTEQLEYEDEQQAHHADGEEPEARRLRERGATGKGGVELQDVFVAFAVEFPRPDIRT